MVTSEKKTKDTPFPLYLVEFSTKQTKQNPDIVYNQKAQSFSKWWRLYLWNIFLRPFPTIITTSSFKPLLLLPELNANSLQGSSTSVSASSSIYFPHQPGLSFKNVRQKTFIICSKLSTGFWVLSKYNVYSGLQDPFSFKTSDLM